MNVVGESNRTPDDVQIRNTNLKSAPLKKLSHIVEGCPAIAEDVHNKRRSFLKVMLEKGIKPEQLSKISNLDLSTYEKWIATNWFRLGSE